MRCAERRRHERAPMLRAMCLYVACRERDSVIKSDSTLHIRHALVPALTIIVPPIIMRAECHIRHRDETSLDQSRKNSVFLTAERAYNTRTPLERPLPERI